MGHRRDGVIAVFAGIGVVGVRAAALVGRLIGRRRAAGFRVRREKRLRGRAAS
jgi:hypothetical protein